MNLKLCSFFLRSTLGCYGGRGGSGKVSSRRVPWQSGSGSMVALTRVVEAEMVEMETFWIYYSKRRHNRISCQVKDGV